MVADGSRTLTDVLRACGVVCIQCTEKSNCCQIASSSFLRSSASALLTTCNVELRLLIDEPGPVAGPTVLSLLSREWGSALPGVPR